MVVIDNAKQRAKSGPSGPSQDRFDVLNADSTTSLETSTLPPAYSDSASLAHQYLTGRNQTQVDPEVPPLKIPSIRSNYVLISRIHGNLKDSYLIDPTLDIPESLLPPLPEPEPSESDSIAPIERKRKNLHLEIKHGNLDVEVFIPPVQDSKGKRVEVLLKATHGNIKAKIYRASDIPVHITSQCEHGSITLHIPSTFQGPFTAQQSVHGTPVTFSQLVRERQTTFSSVESVWKGFIGDPGFFFSSHASVNSGTEGDAVWKGDEMIITNKHGAVTIYYDEEAAGRKGCIIC